MTKIILGGGLGGLSAAYYAIKKYPCDKIILIEASDRVGGWLRSWQQEDGTIFEQSARTIRPKGKSGINTLNLLDDLALDNEIVSVAPAASNRMVYVNGQLHTLPSNVLSLFKKQSPFSRPLVSHLFQDVVTPKKTAKDNDESMYDFVNRRFGSEIADYLASPVVCGICGGDAKEISVKLLMESLFEMEQKHGSVTKGILMNMFSLRKKKSNCTESNLYKRSKREQWNVYSFKHGIEVLPKTLKNKLEEAGVVIKLNTNVNKLEINKDYVVAHIDGGKTIHADRLISSLPAKNLSALMVWEHPILATLLAGIPTVSMCVVNLKYGTKLIKDEGFGFLVAPKENLPILGVIYDSCCFPHADNTVLTVMMGGFRFNKTFTPETKESEVIDIALEQIKKILHICKKPEYSKVNFLRDCIPQYIVGHKTKVDAIKRYIDANKLHLSVCGASYDGVGVNDVILSAKNAIEKIEII